jgi:hypothetical protein
MRNAAADDQLPKIHGTDFHRAEMEMRKSAAGS